MNNPEKIAKVCGGGCVKRYDSTMLDRGRVVEDLQDKGYTVEEKGCTGVCGFVVEIPDYAIVNVETTNAATRRKRIAVLNGYFDIDYVDTGIDPNSKAA